MGKKISLKQVEEGLKGLEPEAALQQLYPLKEEYGDALDKLIGKYIKKLARYQAEVDRFNAMCGYEQDAYALGCRFVAGVDEAGRGPLAGPVVAGAVILPEGIFIEGLNDSKQVSAKKRDALYDIIQEKAISYGIGIADQACIDGINILNATRKAMKIAVGQLSPQPDFLLVDAEKVEGTSIPQRSIIKGDALSISIAAASILAKVTRDRMMDEIDALYPAYGFIKHKGYGTSEHVEAIKKFGLCPIHRISFTKNFV